MLESIRIKGFRKYKDLSVDGFKRMNFILGDNNVGKTTLLEAIFAWACGQNVTPFMSIPISRGRYNAHQQPYWMMEEILTCVNDKHKLPLEMTFEGVYNGQKVSFSHQISPSELLTDFDSSYKNSVYKVVPRTNEVPMQQHLGQNVFPGLSPFLNQLVVAEWKVKSSEKKELSSLITSPFTPVRNVKPFVIAKYIDVLAQTAIEETVQIYAALKREGKLKKLVKEIQKVYPEIDNFDMLPYPDGSQAPVSIVKKDGTMLPMYAYGDGVQRWFFIMGAIILHKNSIICIDEIDTGFHPAAQVEFCKNLIEYAEKNNVQLFITTHNLEFIDGLLEAGETLPEGLFEEIRLYTLKDNGDDLRIRGLDSKEALEARGDFDAELR